MDTNKINVAQKYWLLMEKNYDFLLCFSISSGEIYRRSGFEHICVKLNTIDNYYDLINEYKHTYINKHSIDEFTEKTGLDYLITHEKVKFVGLENIENQQQRWYEYTIVVDGDYGAFFIQDIHDLHCKMLQLEYLSSTDHLTDLYNRQTFESMVDQMIHEKKNFALLLIDVDDFKSINDQHGHLKGDCVLKEFAQLLKEHLGKNAVIGRYGGDEFIAYIEILTDRNHLESSLKTLQNRLLQKLTCGIKTSTSIGISFYPKNGKSRKDLIHSSDQALYKAKIEGKEGYRYYDDLL
jgi:diguanylate cyclase (GGDEF)-like protein